MTRQVETTLEQPERLEKNGSLLKVRVVMFVQGVVQELSRTIPNFKSIDAKGVIEKVSMGLYRITRNELPMVEKLIAQAEMDNALEKKKGEVIEAIELSIASTVIQALDPLLWNSKQELQRPPAEQSPARNGSVQAVWHAEIGGRKQSFTRHLIHGCPLGFSEKSGLRLHECRELVKWAVKRGDHAMPPALQQALEGRLL